MNPFLAKLFTWLLDWLLKKGLIVYEKVKAGMKRKKANDENLVKYEEAVKSGDLDAIAKSGEDLLNGTTQPKP